MAIMIQKDFEARSSIYRLREITHSVRVLDVAFVLGLGLAGACGDSNSGDDEGCEMGALNCSCFPNLTCLGGLQCSGNICVPPAGGSNSASTTSSTGTTGGTAETTGGTTAGTTDGTAGTTSGSQDGGPIVVDFGTNVKKITEGESVIFTATLTDPDGPDDIQGGSLKSADESVTYGAFSDLGNGTYELTLAWASIDQAIGIEFQGSDTVDFKAVFYDNQGKKGFATTSIDLTCGDTYAILACDGHCVHADEDTDHCGTCGNACSDGVQCRYGTCDQTFGECLLTADTPYATCAEYCLAQGEECVAECGDNKYYSVVRWYDVNTCDGKFYDVNSDDRGCVDTWPFESSALSIACCCTNGALWPPP